ncbi:MAG: hypothetical protein RL307_321 [Pseudomonadota bacterium]|jgi:rhodanese-related sulfurtransferase
MKSIQTLLATLMVIASASAVAQNSNPVHLRIIDTDTRFVVKKPDGKELVIQRVMTPCAMNAGWLQPVIPVAGVHPVGEIEILNAMNDPNALIVDMREPGDREKGTIPGSVSIVYTEVAQRMDELGCKKVGNKWDCAAAKQVYAFCNGPVCPQSPSAIKAMTRDGFPADKIHYYRGGMLDWAALGFPVIKGEF